MVQRPVFTVSVRCERPTLLGTAIEKAQEREQYHKTRAEELLRDYLLLQGLDKSVSDDRDIAVAIAEKFEALARSVRTSFDIQPPSQGFPMAMMPTALAGEAPEAEEPSPEISSDEHQAIRAKMP